MAYEGTALTFIWSFADLDLSSFPRACGTTRVATSADLFHVEMMGP